LAFKQKVDSTTDLNGYFWFPGLIDCHTHVLLQGDITNEYYDVQVLKRIRALPHFKGKQKCRYLFDERLYYY